MIVGTLHLSANAWVPNNSRLPVVIYQQALPSGGAERMASNFEQLFLKNGWPPKWRDGVFDYHHFHSTAHEVLGCAAGWCTVIIGGPGGREMTFVAGDVLLLPAGTGHCSKRSSPDFLVVGAYPSGQTFDICRAAPTAEQMRNIDTVPMPTFDPVTGATPFIKRMLQSVKNESSAPSALR